MKITAMINTRDNSMVEFYSRPDWFMGGFHIDHLELGSEVNDQLLSGQEVTLELSLSKEVDA